MVTSGWYSTEGSGTYTWNPSALMWTDSREEELRQRVAELEARMERIEEATDGLIGMFRRWLRGKR